MRSLGPCRKREATRVDGAARGAPLRAWTGAHPTTERGEEPVTIEEARGHDEPVATKQVKVAKEMKKVRASRKREATVMWRALKQARGSKEHKSSERGALEHGRAHWVTGARKGARESRVTGSRKCPWLTSVRKSTREPGSGANGRQEALIQDHGT